MFDITVLSRPAALVYRSPGHARYGMVSITNPGDDEVAFGRDPDRVGLLKLAFDDATVVDGPYQRNATLFSHEDAARVLGFVEDRILPTSAGLVVHCEMGISRSRGIAVALEAIYGRGTDVHAGHGYPNGLVVRRTIDQFNTDNRTRIAYPKVIRTGERCDEHRSDGLVLRDDVRVCATCGSLPTTYEPDLVAPPDMSTGTAD